MKAINYSKEIEKPILFSPFLFVSCYSSELIKMDLNKFEQVLKSCKKEGAEFIELHLDIPDINLIKDKLLLAKGVFSFKPISINIGRDKYSNASIVELIKILEQISKRILLLKLMVAKKKIIMNIMGLYNLFLLQTYYIKNF